MGRYPYIAQSVVQGSLEVDGLRRRNGLCVEYVLKWLMTCMLVMVEYCDSYTCIFMKFYQMA